MDILYITVFIFTLFLCPSYGADPLKVNLVSGNQTEKIDLMVDAKNIDFLCHFNRGAMFILQNEVQIIHVHPITGVENILAQSGSLEEGSPTYYHAGIIEHGYDFPVVNFTIKTVRASDDGKLICRVASKAGDEEEKSEMEIVVHRPMTSLSMTLGEFDAITENLQEPLTIDHGVYKVKCTVEGSNPAVEKVDMYFDDTKLETEEPVVTLMEGTERRYKTVVEGKVKIMVKNSGQELHCQAEDSTGTSKSVKLGVNVNIYDPAVTCNDTDAFHGMDNPVLYCTVNYTDLEVKGFAYQIGDTGEIIRPGDSHSKNIQVTVVNKAPGISVVSLDLHKAELEYLDKHYYILIDMEGGHTSKESVRLNKVEGEDPGNGAERIPSCAFVYVLMCIVFFWSL